MTMFGQRTTELKVGGGKCSRSVGQRWRGRGGGAWVVGHGWRGMSASTEQEASGAQMWSFCFSPAGGDEWGGVGGVVRLKWPLHRRAGDCAPPWGPSEINALGGAHPSWPPRLPRRWRGPTERCQRQTLSSRPSPRVEERQRHHFTCAPACIFHLIFVSLPLPDPSLPLIPI